MNAAADQLEVLRAEHAAEGVGPELWHLLNRVVWATAPTYPAAAYSQTGTWSQAALEDIRQDWVTNRLLTRGDLQVLIGSARSLPGLRSLLVRSLRQHMINSRHRSSATNLFTRMTKMLAADEQFHNVLDTGRPSIKGWALDENVDNVATGDVVKRLLQTAHQRSDEDWKVVRYGPASLKSSPILRQPELREFLTTMLDAADGYVTTEELFTVIRYRFNLTEPSISDLDETALPTRTSVDADISHDCVARSVVAQLTQAEITILDALHANEDDPKATATSIGIVASDIAAALEHECYLIAEYAQSYEEAVTIAQRVGEYLYVSSETL